MAMSKKPDASTLSRQMALSPISPTSIAWRTLSSISIQIHAVFQQEIFQETDTCQPSSNGGQTAEQFSQPSINIRQQADHPLNSDHEGSSLCVIFVYICFWYICYLAILSGAAMYISLHFREKSYSNLCTFGLSML